MNASGKTKHSSHPRQSHSPKEGALSEPRRVLEVLQDILTISASSAQELRRQYPEEFSQLQQVCTEMAWEYGQWSRNLSLGLALDNYHGFSPSPNSTLRSCDGPDAVPRQHQDLVQLRALFMRKLYALLPDEERVHYADLLAVRSYPSGLPDDVGAIEVLNTLEQSFHSVYLELENRILDRCPALIEASLPIPHEMVKDIAVDIAERFDAYAARLKRAHPQAQPDSLAARLILNGAVNRVVLELDEFSRLHNDTLQEMEQVTHLLACVLPQGIPTTLTDDDVFDWVLKAFTLEAEDIVDPKKWHPLTVEQKPLLMAWSKQLLDAYCVQRSHGQTTSFRTIHGQAHSLLLMASCLAWSYCTGAKHDIRVPGAKHRKVNIIHSRSNPENVEMIESMKALVFRQYGLLFYSNQHRRWSVFELRDYSLAADVKRSMLRRFLVDRMKELSLAQWKSITAPPAAAGND